MSAAPSVAQSATSEGGSSTHDREAGLDPDLQRLVDQIVGLRLSEERLLINLSPEDRSRVLEAVVRLLAPPPVEVSATDATGAPVDQEVAADAEVAVEAEGAETALTDDEVAVSLPSDDADAQSATGFEPPVRISDGRGGASSSEAGERAEEDRSVDPAASSSDSPSTPASQDSVACPAWLVWDTNEDRQLSGADRYWRHFVVWIDDGDGVAEADEMRDTFELGLRKLDLDLRSYEGAKDSTGVVERREFGGLERIRVELLRGSADYGMLAIDLAGMVRGQAPRLRLRSADGESTRDLTDGYVPIQEGLEVEQVFGAQTRWRPLLCDR